MRNREIFGRQKQAVSRTEVAVISFWRKSTAGWLSILTSADEAVMKNRKLREKGVYVVATPTGVSTVLDATGPYLSMTSPSFVYASM